MCACAETVLVSQLVSHGEGHRETRVLADAAAAMGLTHARHVGQSQRLAGDVDGCTDVLPGKDRRALATIPLEKTERTPSYHPGRHACWRTVSVFYFILFYFIFLIKIN